jgi:hypothetical protein
VSERCNQLDSCRVHAMDINKSQKLEEEEQTKAFSEELIHSLDIIVQNV